MRTRLSSLMLIVLPGMMILSQPQAQAQKSCESLAQLALPQTKITLAQTVAAGAFTPPGPPPMGAPGWFVALAFQVPGHQEH